MSFSDNSSSTFGTGSQDDYPAAKEYTDGLGALAVNSYTHSPYTDPNLFSLEVGPNKTRFRVHRTILSQSPELDVKPSGLLWGERTAESIALPDLDEQTAHTLVHYLYSGKYQSLQHSKDSEAEDDAIAAHKLSTCVYCAAMRYKLPGLADLAKGKIMSTAEELSIIEKLKVARDQAYPRLSEEETWYSEYLEGAIQNAVEKDPELFTKPEFVHQIEGDVRFRQVVMGAVVKTFAVRGGGRGGEDAGVETPMASDAVGVEASLENSFTLASNCSVPADDDSHRADDDQDPIAEEVCSQSPQPEIQEEEPVRSPNPVEELCVEVEENLCPPEITEKDELGLEEIEPSAPNSVEPEPFTDELDFAKSKTYQRMGKKEGSPTQDMPLSTDDSTTTRHKRIDSVVQEQGDQDAAPAEKGASKSDEHDGNTPESNQEASEEIGKVTASVGAGAGKKSKRNKKKKSGTTF